MPTLEIYNGYAFWPYLPSLTTAAIFSVIFGLMTAAYIGNSFAIVHGSAFLSSLAEYVCIRLSVFNDYPPTAIVEFVGYAGRAIAYNNIGVLITYVLQSTLLLITPIVFAASLFMNLSRIIRCVNGESYSLIPPRWLTRVFVFGDISSFVIQSRGAGIRVQTGRGNSNISPEAGAKIIVSGLVLQITILAICMATVMFLHSTFGPVAASNGVRIPWRQSLYMLYATSVLIMA